MSSGQHIVRRSTDLPDGLAAVCTQTLLLLGDKRRGEAHGRSGGATSATPLPVGRRQRRRGQAQEGSELELEIVRLKIS